MSNLIFLDANVFMYAAGAAHPYKSPCVRILTDVEQGILQTAINAEILQELLYRYSHIQLAQKGIQLCRDILCYPLTVLPITEADVELALDLFEEYQGVGLKPRDAIHAATMRNNGLRQLISADKDFDALDFIVRVDPASYTPTP